MKTIFGFLALVLCCCGLTGYTRDSLVCKKCIDTYDDKSNKITPAKEVFT
jgi:hypothetical protein